MIVQTSVPEAMTEMDPSDTCFACPTDTDDYQAVGIGKVRFLEHYRIPTHGGHGHSGGRRNHLKSGGNLRSRSKRCRHTQAKKQRDRYQRHNVGNGFHIKPPSKNSGSRYYARALPFIL